MMKLIVIIGVFQACFFAFLLLQKRKKKRHHKVLASWLIYLAVFLGVYAFYSEELFWRFPWLVNAWISLLLLHGPFLYFYTRSLIFEHEKIFSVKSSLHLLPFILFNLYLVVAFQFPQTGALIQLDYVEKEINLPWHYAFFLFVIVLSGPVYFLWATYMLRRHGVRILGKLSDVENVNLSWLRNLVIVFGIIWTSLMIIALVHHAMFLFSTDFCTNGLFASLAVFIVLIGYYGLKQQVIIASEEPQKTRQRYAGSVLQNQTAQKYLRELEDYMEREKPFLEEGLTLQQLAGKTEIPAHYLSQVINEYRGQNFFDFVNTYRVNYFIDKMNDPHYSGYTLLGIALESGFSSKTSFNRVFKKITGYPPGEYRKKHAT